MIKSLYVHIPFCLKKCLYCDFNSHTNINIQNDYVKALEKELFAIAQKEFETIFVGGGTPTILSVENFESMLKRLSEFRAKEFTVECNPGTLSLEKLQLMRRYGVNRLSIGLQAWQDQHLVTLGRIHTQQEFVENYQLAREVGFDNINIDLMFGIPNQTLADWKETLEKVLLLRPEHLSCYGLIVEEGTPFYQLYESGVYTLTDEDLEREMYEYTIEKLAEHGYKHYEISNFSLTSRECRHNITYWKNEQYFGAGAGAHSFANGVRYANTRSVEAYISNMCKSVDACIEERVEISKPEEISEYMFLGLRMLDGISKEDFKNRFGVELSSIYEVQLQELKQLQLIVETEKNIALTRLGVDLSNQVFVRFIN
jgi:oxygen-independent coproporphyrinogen III oxidase